MLQFQGVRLGKFATVAVTAATLIAWAASAPATAEEWPNRTVRIIVPYGAGGLGDTHTRLMAERLTKRLGQSFVVENRPGAGGTTAIDAVLRMPRDGYTFVFIGGMQYTLLPLMQKLSYDPYKDLQPVAIVGRWGMVLGVNVESPISSFKEFIAYARANPGKVDYSSAGPGGANHLAGAALAGREKLDMVHVPFGSGPQSLMAVMSKNIFAHFGNPTDMIQATRGGKIKSLAVSSPKRMPQLPEVPTMSETIPGFELTFWQGFIAAGGIPPEAVERMSKTLGEISQEPEMVKRLYDLGIESTAIMPAEFRQIAERERAFYEQLADSAGLRRR